MIAGAGPRGVRFEHWTDARQQGRLAGRNLVTGEARPYDLVPYVWSDQHGRQLQMLGDCAGDVEFVRGASSSDSYVALIGRRGVVVGAVAFGDPAGFRLARRVVTRRNSWPACLQLDWQAA